MSSQFTRKIDSQAEVIEDLKRHFDSQTEYVLELESGMSEQRVKILNLKGSLHSLEADNGGQTSLELEHRHYLYSN